MLDSGFCLIPLVLGWHFPTKYGGNGGLGGAGALVIGLIFLLLALVGLTVSIFKFIKQILK